MAACVCQHVVGYGCWLNAEATSFWMLLPLRFFVGVGFGTGQPSAVAILMEISPVQSRALNQGFAQMAFAMGELYCCLVPFSDPFSTCRRFATSPLPCQKYDSSSNEANEATNQEQNHHAKMQSSTCSLFNLILVFSRPGRICP